MVLPLQWHAECYLYQQAVKVPQDWHLKILVMPADCRIGWNAFLGY